MANRIIQTIGIVRRIAIKTIYYNRNRDYSTWIFGEWFGNRCDDNSLYLANYVASRAELGINVFWVAKEDCDTSLLDSRIKIIRYDSREARHYFRTAGVVVMNQGMEDFSEKGYNYFDGAIILNLWHGVPWKKIGLDGGHREDDLDRWFLKTLIKMQGYSYFLSTSKVINKHICSAFDISEKNILNEGYPRNSVLYDTEKRDEVRKALISELRLDKSYRIIAYLPTFRDSEKTSFSFFSFCENNKSFAELLKEEKILIIEKNHFVDMKRHLNSEEYLDNIVVNGKKYHTQELLLACDLLITDYSSCFFDYLLTDRPIIHFLYDYEYYRNNDRGLYYEPEDVAGGVIVYDSNDLLSALLTELNDPLRNEKLRKLRREEFLASESAASIQNITEVLLNECNRRNR